MSNQLVHDKTPITEFTRAVVRSWPGPSIATGGVVVFVVGQLFAHFIWDAGLL